MEKLNTIVCPNAGVALFLVLVLENEGFPSVWTTGGRVITMAPKVRIKAAAHALVGVA